MLTALEKAVLEKLLARRGDPFDTLRQQVSCGSVSKREFSGVGYVTEFALPASVQVARDVSDMREQPPQFLG